MRKRVLFVAAMAAGFAVTVPSARAGEDVVCGFGHVAGVPLPVEECAPPCPGVRVGPVTVGTIADAYVCVRP